MKDLRYLRILELILLASMGYFTLLPVIPDFLKTEFFFRKPSYNLFDKRIIDQMQQEDGPRVRVNLPSYEMLLKMGGKPPSQVNDKVVADKKPQAADGTASERKTEPDNTFSPGSFMEEKTIPSAPLPPEPSSIDLRAPANIRIQGEVIQKNEKGGP